MDQTENNDYQNQKEDWLDKGETSGIQVAVPNSTAVLVLGILSIPGCCCYGIVGIVLGIIAIVLGGNALSDYKLNPSSFTEGSVKNVRAGRICGIIGLIFGAMYGIFLLLYFYAVVTYPLEVKEWLEALQNIQ